jgi:RES domain
VAALRPAERPRRPPRRPGWVLHTVLFPSPLRLYRITRVAHPSPAHYGRGRTFRFDAPDASYGVCYFGTSLAAAFVEAVPLALVPTSGDRLVEEGDLRARYASRAGSIRQLELAFFADDGLALNGIDLRVTGGDDYKLSQGWSHAIHQHHPLVDGILYASRHHNSLYCVALFERARGKVRFWRPHWGVLGDHAVPDLFGQTAALFRRFSVKIHP